MKAEDFFNQISNSESAEAEALATKGHRTIQQGAMRFCLAYISQLSNVQNFDMRNEASVKASIILSQIIREKNLDYLPYI